MKTKTVGKFATALMVLLLVLSGMMVLQSSALAEESEDGKIVGRIQANDGTTTIRPKGVEVRLMDVSQRDVSMDRLMSIETSAGGYFSFDDLGAGYYKVIVPSQSDMVLEKVFFKNNTDVVQLNEGQKLDMDYINVEYKNLEYKITGNVTDSDGESISMPMVHIQDMENNYHQQADIIDQVNGTYEIYAYGGDFILKAEAENYMANTTVHTISSDVEQDIILEKSPVSPMVSGFIYDQNDVGIESQIDVTLYDMSNGTMIHETVESGPYYEIPAVDGNYTIVLNAEGYEPIIHHQLINSASTLDYYFGVEHVDSFGDEDIHFTIDFADEDWSNLTLTTEREILPNTVFEGLDYSYLGNYRMQIDMALGDGDLVLESNEKTNFTNWMEYREAKMMTTGNMIKLDGHTFSLANVVSTPSFGSISTGDATTIPSSSFTITSEVEYQSNHVELDEDMYDMSLELMNDHTVENLRDYSYEIILRNGYERTNSPAGIDLEGYSTITIDTEENIGTTSLSLDIRAFEVGEVSLTIEQGVDVYQKDNMTYVVKQGSDVKATSDYDDPIGQDEGVNYSWQLDGTELEKYTKTITHTFEDEGEETLTIVVTETSGEQITEEVTIVVDGSGPTGSIDADNTTIDEGEIITFSASSFEDDTPIPEDGYEWNFSDGSEMMVGENVTHRFNLKGTYTVNLNITDSIGNYNDGESITITVEDATKPVARYTAMYGGETKESQNISKINIERYQNLTLDAGDSYDPAGYEAERTDVDTVTWWLEEKNEKITETETEFIFDKVTSYTLFLNVTDAAGNYHNISTPIEVTPGPTPNLEIANFSVSKSKPTAGNKITVEIKVTNYGTAHAEDVQVTFKVDNKTKSVTPEFYNEDGTDANDTIEKGGSKTIKFDYKPGDKGKETLTINVTDSDEPAGWYYDNEDDLSIDVQAPAWRQNIALILIPVIIIGVSVALYYYKEKIFGE